MGSPTSVKEVDSSTRRESYNVFALQSLRCRANLCTGSVRAIAGNDIPVRISRHQNKLTLFSKFSNE
jgi:hypothetical protein